MPVETLRTRLGDANRVLLLDDGLSGERTCHDLLTAADRPQRVLGVTYIQSPKHWLRTHGLDRRNTEALAVLDVGGQQSAQQAFADGGLTSVTSLSNPGDLTGLGIQLNRQLEDWADAPGDLVLCFDSITSLLQYTDVETAYRFLHLLGTRLNHADGTGFFHFNPSAHDDRTRHTLLSLFDATVEVDSETGEYKVQSR